MPKVDVVLLDPAAVDSRRKARFLTVPLLSERARCSAASLWAARHGRPIGLRIAQRIARVLGAPLGALIASGGESPENNAGDVLGAVGLRKNEVAQ